jgi:hypothetical protein
LRSDLEFVGVPLGNCPELARFLERRSPTRRVWGYFSGPAESETGAPEEVTRITQLHRSGRVGARRSDFAVILNGIKTALDSPVAGGLKQLDYENVL